MFVTIPLSSQAVAKPVLGADLRQLQAKLAHLEGFAKEAIADSKGVESKTSHSQRSRSRSGSRRRGEPRGNESPAAEIKSEVAADHKQLREADT